MSTNLDQPELRELDRRRGDGFDVRLLWSERTGKVFVAVEDVRTSEAFRIAVDPDHALDAFHHPYAYAYRPGRPATVRRAPDVAALPNGS